MCCCCGNFAKKDHHHDQQYILSASFLKKLTSYYDRDEVDGLIPDLSGYYTKSEVDLLIPDLSDYYTKSEIDDFFEDYYTKDEIDDLLPGHLSFAANRSGSLSNATGDGTRVEVACNLERFQVNSFGQNGYSSGTGEFVAPITSVYQFHYQFYLYGFASMTHNTIQSGIKLSSSYLILDQRPFIAGTTFTQVRGSLTHLVTAGQSVRVFVEVSGGAKDVSIEGTSYYTGFSGYLINDL